jgi:CRP-like cAMP-binding protein
MGEIGRNFWIILRGSVFVLTPIIGIENEERIAHYIDFSKPKEVETYEKNADMKIANILTQGMSFGESALLHRGKRTATIVCRENSYFAVLS